MANAIDSVSNFLREELPRVLHESLPAVAPFFKDIVATSVGVRADESRLGRSWNVIHLYSAGIAGLIKYANPNGPAMITVGNLGKQTHLIDFVNASSPFPTALEAPHAGSLKRTLTLHMTTGNFSVPVTWMQSDALSASQIKQVARDIKAVGDLRAMVEASGFHSYQATSASGYIVKVLGMVNSVAEVGTSNTVTVTLLEQYGTIHNFRVGQVIEFWASAGTEASALQDGTATDGTDCRNYTPATAYYVHAIIQDVDYINRRFTMVGVNDNTGAIVAWANATGWQGTNGIAQYDYIVLKDCASYADTGNRPMPTWGLEDWIKSSGYILGGSSGSEALDLDTYSQFKSNVTDISGPLTEDVLNKHVGNYLDAYPGLSLDTIITTNGVTQKFLQQYALNNNKYFYDRAGKSLNVQGGWAEVGYEFNGRVLRWIVDPMCLKERLYALKLQGGNVKRYVPPTISGGDERIAGGAGTDGEVQFLAPIGGHTGVFMVARTSTGAALDILEAPFFQYCLIAPIDPRGIKLTNLTEVASS